MYEYVQEEIYVYLNIFYIQEISINCIENGKTNLNKYKESDLIFKRGQRMPPD